MTASDAHREQVGGLWDEVGALQIAFLREQGLAPSDALLDVGCGCLRGGVHFVAYLEPGRYYGIDRDAGLVRAGLEIELPRAGLAGRLLADHLLVNDAFEASRFGVAFDVAWAQSLFTHLLAADIRRCLEEVARVVRPGGRFYATFFRAGDDPAVPVTHRPGGIVTHPDLDPYHYRFRDLEALCAGLPWRAADLGGWSHPRAQQMARFDRSPE
jgi:SAM-dependent methyltransferase